MDSELHIGAATKNMISNGVFASACVNYSEDKSDVFIRNHKCTKCNLEWSPTLEILMHGIEHEIVETECVKIITDDGIGYKKKIQSGFDNFAQIYWHSGFFKCFRCNTSYICG